MEEKIKELITDLYEDVKEMRNTTSVNERIGMEVIALNAISSAYKAVNGIESCSCEKDKSAVKDIL